MLLGSRVFLGSIEATNGPSTPSLLGDYYPVSKRNRTYGMFAIGTQVGSILGFVVGGTVATLFGWREAFLAMGATGILTGFVVSRVLPEPERGLADALHRAESELAEIEAGAGGAQETDNRENDGGKDADHRDLRALTSREALASVLRVPTVWVLAASSTVSLFFTSSLGTWLPSYFRRYHGLSAAAAGGLLAVLTVFLIAGVVVGGRRGDRALGEGGPQRRIVMIAGCLFAQVFAWLGLFTVDSLAFGIACIAVVAVLTGFPLGIVGSAMLDVFPSHLRGLAAGIQTIMRVVATASAPVLFGVLSDMYGLRSAWLYTLPALPVAAAITLLATRTYPGDMRAAQLVSLHQHRLEAGQA
jgi:MFS family permease